MRDRYAERLGYRGLAAAKGPAVKWSARLLSLVMLCYVGRGRKQLCCREKDLSGLSWFYPRCRHTARIGRASCFSKIPKKCWEPLGFYRQCSGKKDAGVIAEHEAGLNTVDRILVG
jgi:hypothetical protein